MRTLTQITQLAPFSPKAAFDTCGTLLESCLPNIEIFAFLQCILNGLSDESFDVRILVQLILQRLAIVSPTAVSQKLDDVVEPLKATILTPVKANAVKQEVEQTNELVRSAVKTGVWLWKNLLEGGSAGASGGSSGGGAATGMCPKFEEFAKEVLFHEHSAVAEVVRQVSNEIDSVSSKGTAMDLS